MNKNETQSKGLQKIDLFQESINSLIIIAFPKSTSKNFSFALSIAESASRYAITEFNGKILHIAIFSKSASDAGKAKLLLNYTYSWKGTLIFQGGKLRDNYTIGEVISCFIIAESCKDSKAHCLTIISLESNRKIKKYIFPCKLISYYFKYQEEHPASIQDQIQALAVNRGCDWCPNFNTENFRQCEIKKDEKEVKSFLLQLK